MTNNLTNLRAGATKFHDPAVAPRNKGGAPRGNTNALKHGGRTAVAIACRKRAAALSRRLRAGARLLEWLRTRPPISSARPAPLMSSPDSFRRPIVPSHRVAFAPRARRTPYASTPAAMDRRNKSGDDLLEGQVEQSLNCRDSDAQARYAARMTDIPVFEAIHNFRDFGGYAVPGGRVRRGLLFRSAHYAEATDADLAAFATLKMAAIVDLRRPGERVRYPTRRASACAAQIIAYGVESHDDEPPHLSFIKDGESLQIAEISRRMTGIYRELAFLPGHVETFSAAFAALAEIDRPLVVHCHAGKDRTGLLVALIHRLLGVNDADIFHDYLRTNTESRIAERVPAIARQIEAATGIALDPAVVAHIYGVERPYLEAAFTAIEAEHGSIAAYLTERLGVTEAQAARIRGRLVEPA